MEISKFVAFGDTIIVNCTLSILNCLMDRL